MNKALFLNINNLGVWLPDSVWIHITNLGDATVALAILVCFYRYRSDRGLAILILALLTTILIQGMKHLFGIDRPPVVLDTEMFRLIGGPISTNSFPSGHTATAFVCVGILSAQYMRLKVVIPLVLIAALVGISRITVGVHWPLDVLAGAIVGWILGFYGYRAIVRGLQYNLTIEILSLVTVLVVLLNLIFYQFPYSEYALVGWSKWVYLALALIGLFRFILSSPLRAKVIERI